MLDRDVGAVREVRVTPMRARSARTARPGRRADAGAGLGRQLGESRDGDEGGEGRVLIRPLRGLGGGGGSEAAHLEEAIGIEEALRGLGVI